MHEVKSLICCFLLNVKDTAIFQCLRNIRLSYQIKKYFSDGSIRMRMYT